MSHLPNVYAIISKSDIELVDFSQVPEDRPTLRWSLNGLEFLIKWFDEHDPTFIIDGSVIPLSLLTQVQSFALMQTPEWSLPIETE